MVLVGDFDDTGALEAYFAHPHHNEAARETALDAVRRLETAPEVESVTVGRNVGTLATDFDWILDVQVADEQTCKQLVQSDLYARVMGEITPLTKHEWTARISHVMRGI